MKLAPRYGREPILRLDGAPSAANAAMVRQRRRFAELLARLSDDQWAAASRCDQWTVQDIAAHLVSVDRFWHYSITSGLAGNPTKVLGNFDPKETPAAIVAAARDASPAETLVSFVAASDALCTLVDSLDDAACDAVAESPLGHVAVNTLVHHALWDAWVHERDVAVPLGIEQPHESDEIVASLRFVAGLNAAVALRYEPSGRGVCAIVADRPAARVVTTVEGDVRVDDREIPDDAIVLRGDAVELLEGLSVRAPLATDAWMANGLRVAFA